MPLHADGHFVDAGHVFALHHTFKVHVAEGCHLHAQGIIKMTLGAKNEDVGLYAHALQLFDRVLGGFGLQFVCRFQIGHIGEMHTHGITSELPAQLSDGFHEGGTLDVADGAAHFGDDEVEGGPSPQPFSPRPSPHPPYREEVVTLFAYFSISFLISRDITPSL